MTAIPTPEAVEPMTPIRALATIRRWADHMRAENSVLQTRAGVRISADVIDAALSVIATFKARALPAPRRYTGGPLEDGLYLWREDHWDAGWWDSEYVSGGRGQPWWARRGSAPEEPIWLIGPIPTPDLPEEEAANG